jgi:hypothetical protein
MVFHRLMGKLGDRAAASRKPAEGELGTPRGCGDHAAHGVDLLPRWALAPVFVTVQALRGISIPGTVTLGAPRSARSAGSKTRAS